MAATPDWADLIDAPLDDEPFTEEDRAAADRALEHYQQGHYVLLDDLIAECERAETQTVIKSHEITASSPRQ